MAATSGQEEIVQYLCQHSTHLDLLDNKARSALYLAIEAENFGVAEILAASGASIICDGDRLAKMLCYIGFEGNLKKLRFLVKVDTDIQQADYDKRTLGHLAAAEGHIEMLEFMARQTKFNFEMKDRWGNSVLEEMKDE